MRKLQKMLFALCCFFPVLLFPQDEDNLYTFKFGPGISVDQCYRNLSGDPAVVNSRNETEIPKPGYSFGLTGYYYFNKAISAGLGISLSNRGEQTENIPLIAQSGSSLVMYGDIQHTYNYNYIDFPLTINYLPGHRDLKFLFTAGFSPSLFVSHKIYTVINESGSRTKEKQDNTAEVSFYKINPVLIAGAGLELEIDDHFHLVLQPVYRTSIQSIANEAVKSRLYSYGVWFSFQYSL